MYAAQVLWAASSWSTRFVWSYRLAGLSSLTNQLLPLMAAVVPSTQGKIELEAIEDHDVAEVISALVALAVRQSFTEHVVLEEAGQIVAAFADEVVVHTGDDLPDADYAATLAAMPALAHAVERVVGPDAGPGERASALEFVLEGLYLTKRLAKDAAGPRALYRSRGR